MKLSKRGFFLFIWCCFFFGAGWVAASPSSQTAEITLSDCVEAALRLDEGMKINEAKIRRADAMRREAVGGALPDVRWKWEDTLQDTHNNGSGSGVENTFLRRETRTSKFTLEQPLFHGLKEFSAERGFKALTREARFSADRSGKELVQKVTLAFFNVLALEKDLGNVREILGYYAQRVKELRQRVRLGRSRESEVLTAESQWANFKSQERDRIGAIQSAREQLAFLTGLEFGDTPLVDGLSGFPDKPSLNEALGKVAKRSDVQSLEEDVRAKRYALRAIKGDFWPTLDLTGNYYTQRVGFQENIDWDVITSLEIPISQGGGVAARARAAAADLQISELALQALRRRAASEIKTAYLALQTSLDKSAILENATDKATRSYRAQVKEYRLGLVSNLDVLSALSNLIAVKRDWDQARFETKFEWIRLNTALETSWLEASQ